MGIEFIVVVKCCTNSDTDVSCGAILTNQSLMRGEVAPAVTPMLHRLLGKYWPFNTVGAMFHKYLH